MAELANYLQTLKGRSARVAVREIKSRFVRGPAKAAVRRVMDICEHHNAPFTFFMTGNCAIVNRSFVSEILGRGHEISCHGYNHLRYDKVLHSEARRDLTFAKRLFGDLFGITLEGFRAPYLGMNEEVANLLKEQGLSYSSSVMGNETFTYQNGLAEFPISACDWHTLIRDNDSPEIFLRELLDKQRHGTVYELHPWRMGQRKYCWVLEKFLKNSESRFIAMSGLSRGEEGIVLSGDLGELGLLEVAGRVLLGHMTDYNKTAATLGWESWAT